MMSRCALSSLGGSISHAWIVNRPRLSLLVLGPDCVRLFARDTEAYAIDGLADYGSTALVILRCTLQGRGGEGLRAGC